MYFYQIECCLYTQNVCMNKKKYSTTDNSVTNTWPIQQIPMPGHASQLYHNVMNITILTKR